MKYEETKQMFEKVYENLEKNLEKWNTNIAFKDAYDDFVRNLNKLRKLDEKKSKSLGTNIEQKNNLLILLTDNVMPVATVMEVYGNDYDKKLSKTARISKNKLLKAKDSEVLDKCEEILKKGRKNYNKAVKNAQKQKNGKSLKNIASYGLTEEMVNELEVSYKKFKKQSELVKKLTRQENKIEQKIKVLVKKTILLFETKLDKLMELFKLKEPEFYKLFSQSRKIGLNKIVNENKSPIKSVKPQTKKKKPGKRQESKARAIVTT
ncbi:MAG: hypothetical protein JXB00_17495 [Bacteroidales bacterium]|nr:hypothetical protein [Bacteroidales bacterium]